MSRFTDIKIVSWLEEKPKRKEWAWFIALWLGGLLAVTALAYFLRWIMGIS